jgi:hypothetical protein
MRNDYKIRPRTGFAKGGKVKKGGFPDLTGDGKVTFKDVLKGRGVIKKKGGSVECLRHMKAWNLKLWKLKNMLWKKKVIKKLNQAK